MSYFWIAAMVSPPPARVKALVLAIAIAMVLVPSPNWSNSNTPTGPFQSTVPACMMISATSCADCGRAGRAARGHLLDQRLGGRHQVVLAQRFADIMAGGLEEGVGDAAAD